jgi:hypothetical protein
MQLTSAAALATEFGTGTWALPTQPAGRSDGFSTMAVNRSVIGGPTALGIELGPVELGPVELAESERSSSRTRLRSAATELAYAARDSLAPELLHAVNAMGADTAKIAHTANRDTVDLRTVFDDKAQRFNTVSLDPLCPISDLTRHRCGRQLDERSEDLPAPG